MDIKQTTTAFELPGCKITGNKGVVRGVLVRSSSIFGNIGAAFQTLAGGNITLYTELCEKTRRRCTRTDDCPCRSGWRQCRYRYPVRYDRGNEWGYRGDLLRNSGDC